MAWKFPRGHSQTKKLIASCASAGVGIDGLEDAPTFRFIPAHEATRFDWAGRPIDPKPVELHNGPPSERGSIACGKRKAKGIRNWNPTRLDANPMYSIGMAGDSREMTKARERWAMGDPKPLRELLAAEAAARTSVQQREKELVAA